MTDRAALLLGVLLTLSTSAAGLALARYDDAQRARIWARAVEEGRVC